ncbi:hypothetical protein BW247_06745 [Acidihalobacter ferrooxydans]|uniref:Uncharacterized protein n=1 Tax=Acidihalobacter ferrooxydans TaxID=1765967 RepID=A0A1P8UG48_9GAMM|nr:hypothetical protein BW247_06745 [Acidihalobacter ferrooxydans]
MFGFGPGLFGFGPGLFGFGPGLFGFGPGLCGFGPGLFGFGPGLFGFGPGLFGFGPDLLSLCLSTQDFCFPYPKPAPRTLFCGQGHFWPTSTLPAAQARPDVHRLPVQAECMSHRASTHRQCVLNA